jgi:hypothetical protein
LGLDWRVELVCPEGHLWSAHARVEKLVPQLEIRAPATSGLLRKEVKVRPQGLERLFIVAADDDGDLVHASLRDKALGGDTGFDLEARPVTNRIRLTRVAPEGDASVGPFEAAAEDVPALVELANAIRKHLGELERGRVEASSFDGTAIADISDHTALTGRLLAALGPTTCEIAAKSRTKKELIIRRMLGDDRREEIFLDKNALREKYAELPDVLRTLFAPLGLDAPLDATESAPALEVIAVTSVHPDAAEPAPRARLPVNGVLVETFKSIAALLHAGRAGDAYTAFAALFSAPEFLGYTPDEQRRALRLMILAPPPNATSDAVVEAHRAALVPLEALVHAWQLPADLELLQTCRRLLERNPGDA